MVSLTTNVLLTTYLPTWDIHMLLTLIRLLMTTPMMPRPAKNVAALAQAHHVSEGFWPHAALMKQSLGIWWWLTAATNGSYSA